MQRAVEDRAMKKAQLIEAGYLFVDPSVEALDGVAHSTAGPDAGETALTFQWGDMRIRMRVTADPRSEFRLVDAGEGLAILRKGAPFAEGLQYLPNLMHAPGMAFVNVESGCAMDCKFCATPHLRKETRKRVKKEEWLKRLLEAAKREELKSIGITAGVSGIPGKTIADIEWLVKELRKALPDMPIGVEPYVENEAEIDRVRTAGATELKLNLQTYDREVFKRVCPDWDYDRMLRLIEYAAKSWGKERVTANFLIGMGEGDASVEAGMRWLIGLGVVPTVRSLRWNDINREHLEEALGGAIAPVKAERMVRLAKVQQTLLFEAGLNVMNYKTMCHACRACDLVPQTDLITLK